MRKSSKSTSCVKRLKPFTFQLGYFLQGTILFLSVGSQGSLACHSSSHWHGLDNTRKDAMLLSAEMPDKQGVAGIKNHFDRNSMVAWGGWTPAPNVKDDWLEWLKTWEKKTNNSDYMSPENEDKIREGREGPKFPEDWQDLGEGVGGVPAPPWSYVPKNIGKPKNCMLPPKRGDCAQKINRWGYNAYTNKCLVFQYSGCKGNSNNFLTQLECEKLCLPMPTTGCQNDEKILSEDLG